MSTHPTPPDWAEGILRLVLKRTDFDVISGDLLEQYRDAIHPSRGQKRADIWYVVQVTGFVTRSVGAWGAVFGLAVVGRTALDWFVPTSDFYVRANVSTDIGVAVLLLTGIWSAWRSGSFVAGTLAGIATALIGAAISMAGAVGLLAIWHDPQTFAAIDGSGGLGEVFSLPIMMFLPGLVLGSIGGAIGAAARRTLRTP